MATEPTEDSTEAEDFTEREKQLVRDAVKPLRHHTEEYADLYEKVREW